MVKYADYRSHIKSGDLLAWSHRGWKTWHDFKVQAVRFFTQSEYSHVGIAWVFKGRVFVIESVTPVIRIVPLSNLLPCYVAKIPHSRWTPEAEEFAMAMVGVGEYSQWEAIRAYFNDNRDPDAWECAEFVKAVLSHCRVQLEGRAVPSDVVLGAQKLGASLMYIE